MDRWAAKVLALPVFSESFRDAIADSPFVNLAFVASIEVTSGEEFASKVSEWAGTLEAKTAQALLSEPSMLEQFWCLASSVEKAFFESTSIQLGFGLCEPAQAHRVLTETDRLRKASAIKSLLQKPLKAPKRTWAGEMASSSSSTPLLDQENSERHKWGTKLEKIGQRAGNEAKLFDSASTSPELSDSERSRLRQLVLTSGAPRTMAAHVRVWEKFELWLCSQKLTPFPLTLQNILKYALFLDQQECGPSVIPALRTAIKWVTSRLAVKCPDLEDAQLVALQKDVIIRRATTLKEAIPIPIEVVRCLERTVMNHDLPIPTRLFIWWWLCMIFASLRFDDAIHVAPKDLQMSEEGLFGVAWQTKVERRRKGTRFVVPHVGFSTEPWLRTGWGLFQDQEQDRDFWLPELNARDMFRMVPPSYQRSVQWLKVLAREAVDRLSTAPADEKIRCATLINQLSAHSARVTLLDAAVHTGRSTEEIGLQANWKNPGPLVLKYTRNRSAVPARMVQQLVQDLLKEAHPVQETEDVLLDEPEDSALDTVQFFFKQPSPGSYYDYKYHCSQSDDPSKVACNKFLLEECIAMGSVLPDLSVLCKACARARPDVVRSNTRENRDELVWASDQPHARENMRSCLFCPQVACCRFFWDQLEFLFSPFCAQILFQFYW